MFTMFTINVQLRLMGMSLVLKVFGHKSKNWTNFELYRFVFDSDDIYMLNNENI